MDFKDISREITFKQESPLRRIVAVKIYHNEKQIGILDGKGLYIFPDMREEGYVAFRCNEGWEFRLYPYSTRGLEDGL